MEKFYISLLITTIIFNVLYVILPSMHGDAYDDIEEDENI